MMMPGSSLHIRCLFLAVSSDRRKPSGTPLREEKKRKLLQRIARPFVSVYLREKIRQPASLTEATNVFVLLRM